MPRRRPNADGLERSPCCWVPAPRSRAEAHQDRDRVHWRRAHEAALKVALAALAAPSQSQRHLLRHERRAVPGRRVRLHRAAHQSPLRIGEETFWRLPTVGETSPRPVAPCTLMLACSRHQQGLRARPHAMVWASSEGGDRAAASSRPRLQEVDAMPVSIKVNGVFNSLVHKGSGGISIATIPDVCKTPEPGGPGADPLSQHLACRPCSPRAAPPSRPTAA
jgi:hypothetical protein